MTLAELLALLGRCWSRLFLYPGGLGLLIALLLINRESLWLGLSNSRAVAKSQAQDPAVDLTPGSSLLRRGVPSGRGEVKTKINLAGITALAAPWLGLALLPLPLAVSVGRSVDLVFALALLEWPRVLVAIREAHSGQITRLAAALNSYPPLIAALLLLAMPSGSFDIATIGQSPGDTASLLLVAVHWLGAFGIILALPPLLGIGPFTSPPPEEPLARLGLIVRAIGLVAIGTLPWAGLIPEALRWLLPFPILAIVLVTWGLHRIGKQQAALPWAQALLWLCAAEVVMLLLASVEGLALRLQ